MTMLFKIWEGLSQELNYNVMFSQRGVMNLAHNLQDVRDLKRRTHANRLNGIDAVYLNTEEVKKFCPIINTHRIFVIQFWAEPFKEEQVQLGMMLLLGDMQEVLMKWVLI